MNFILASFKSDAASLAAIKKNPRAGVLLCETTSLFYMGNGHRIPFADTEKPMPAPAVLQVDGQDVGFVIGSYYDGFAPGVHLVPVPVPGRSVLVAVKDHYINDLAKITGAELEKTIRDFAKDPQAWLERPRQQSALAPVFSNPGDAAYPLCMVHTRPFRPQDRDRVIMDNPASSNYAIGLQQGYVSPRRPAEAQP